MLRKFYRAAGRDPGELASIIANLNYVLNTKKGFGSWLPRFGIGDYNAYQARDKIVKTLMAEIEENVRLYEPRVALEKIDEVKADSPFRMRFEVQCKFTGTQRPIYIILDSVKNQIFVEE